MSCFLWNLVVALSTMFTGTENDTAVDTPQPDLSGIWIGEYSSVFDRNAVAEAALMIEAHQERFFKGSLMLGRCGVDVEGMVEGDRFLISSIDMPDPDKGGVILCSEPPTPDRMESDPPSEAPSIAILVIQGRVRCVGDPKGVGDPFVGDPTGLRVVLVAEYWVVYIDGTMDAGTMELVLK